MERIQFDEHKNAVKVFYNGKHINTVDVETARSIYWNVQEDELRGRSSALTVLMKRPVRCRFTRD